MTRQLFSLSENVADSLQKSGIPLRFSLENRISFKKFNKEKNVII
jgi:hypothetical protein